MRACIFFVIYFAVIVFFFASVWKVFTKAGKPGWAAIVPIYNWIVLLEIVEKPTWWVVLILLVPVANIIVMIIALMALAEKFGKSAGFGIGLAFLGIIFWPILGFGSAKYVGAAAAPPVQAPPLAAPPAAAPPAETPPQTPPEGQA